MTLTFVFVRSIFRYFGEGGKESKKKSFLVGMGRWGEGMKERREEERGERIRRSKRVEIRVEGICFVVCCLLDKLVIGS